MLLRHRGTLLGVTCTGITLGLGAWQLSRREDKVELLADRVLQLAKDPVELLGPDQSLSAAQRVRLRGRYLLPEAIVRVGLRKNPDPSSNGYGEGDMGYHLMVPFQLEAGPVLLLDRGWVFRDVPVPQEVDTSPVVDIVGIIKHSDSTPIGFSAESAIKSKDRVWGWLDVPSILYTYGIESSMDQYAVVALQVSDNDPFGPCPSFRGTSHLLEHSVMPWKHSMYAGTWLSLSVSIAAMTLHWVRRL